MDFMIFSTQHLMIESEKQKLKILKTASTYMITQTLFFRLNTIILIRPNAMLNSLDIIKY